MVAPTAIRCTSRSMMIKMPTMLAITARVFAKRVAITINYAASPCIDISRFMRFLVVAQRIDTMNRRTWLTAIMTLPFLRWQKPKPKLPAPLIADKPYYVVRATRGNFDIVSQKDGDAITFV